MALRPVSASRAAAETAPSAAMIRRREAAIGNLVREKTRERAQVAALSQSAKLVPQPQEALALGLFTRNEAPIRSSTKSISEPARNCREIWPSSPTPLS